jgi:hypothetical protein
MQHIQQIQNIPLQSYQPYQVNQGTYDIQHQQPFQHEQQQQQQQLQQPSVAQDQHGSSEQHLTKRARRRIQLQTKLGKLEQQFVADKDVHYRDSLVQLQYKLTSLLAGENAEQMEKIRDLEEWRDAELVRLRLAEEYQVKFINDSFKLEYDQTVENTKSVVDMVKTKLQEGLINKIKQLKEDKALIDIVTSSKSVSAHPTSRSRSNLLNDNSAGYSNNYSNTNGNLSNNNAAYNSDGGNNGNTSGFDTSTSFFFSGERRSRRKRNHDNSALHDSNLTNSNDDSYDSATATGSNSRKKSKNNTGNVSSANEDSNKIMTENPVLNEFLYGSKGTARKDKVNMKHPSKGLPHCPPLKPEEINEDLTFLRNYKRGKV